MLSKSIDLPFMHKLFFDHAHNTKFPDAVTAKLASMWDLVFSFCCGAHCGSNGLKRGMASLCSDDILEAVFIMVASLIAGSQALHDHVDVFLFLCLSFEDQKASSDDRKQFWQCLDVDENKLDEFAFLNPRWNGRFLMVNEAARNDPDITTRVKGLVYAVSAGPGRPWW